MAHVKHTFCRICEPLCPLIAEIDEADEIAALEPDRAHPVSKGFACHKGLGYLEVHNDTDRVNTALRRTNARSAFPGAFAPVSWDDAFADIGARLRAIRDQHGLNAIAVYYGNPVSLNSNAFPLAAGLAPQLGSHRLANMASLKRGAHAINPIHMHPADASARALVEGDMARVSNRWGEVTTPVRLDETLRPGVVALSHGYRRRAAPALRRAHMTPGVNANALTPTGPDSYEKLSNTAHLNGVAIVLERHTRLTTKYQGRRE